MELAVYQGAAPRNFSPATLRASIVIPGHLVVYGFTVYSTKGTAQFLNLFDQSTLPADTAVPVFSWPIAANSGVGFSWAPQGRNCPSGLVLCNSSTDASKTIGAADTLFDVQYDLISDGGVAVATENEG